MRTIILQSPGNWVATEIAEPPAPAAGQVLVRPHTMGICGTDIGGFLGKMPFFDYPRIIGHELGVEVLQVGPGVTNVRPGDRCSIEPYLNCGQCYACRHGATNCCQSNQTFGVMCDGGLCERFLIRADKLHLGGSLGYDQLALVETLAIGCHAWNRSGGQSGDQALIIGLGPIGLAVLEFARLAGAQITVMDRLESRLQFCRQQYGVANTITAGDQAANMATVNRFTQGDRYPVVIDATGSHQSMSAALDYVAQTGSLVYVGITNQSLTFPHVTMHKPEMTIKASRNALPDDFSRIINLIEQRLIDTDRWITHRSSVSRLIDDFPTFADPQSGVIKAVVDLDWSGSA